MTTLSICSPTASLNNRFDAVLEALGSDPEWVLNRITPGKINLGSLGDIEACVSQLIEVVSSSDLCPNRVIARVSAAAAAVLRRSAAAVAERMEAVAARPLAGERKPAAVRRQAVALRLAETCRGDSAGRLRNRLRGRRPV